MKVNGKGIHNNCMCFCTNISTMNAYATSFNSCHAHLLTYSGLTIVGLQLFVKRNQMLNRTKEVALWVTTFVVV
jgi:hypothetical protein